MDDETSNTKANLEGYVCPECRILFALPDGVAGNGALCPNCNSLLSIPLPDDGVDSLGVAKIKYKQAGFYTKESVEETMIAKQRRAARHGQGLGEEIQWRWLIPASLFVVLLLGSLSWLLLRDDEKSITEADANTSKTDNGILARGVSEEADTPIENVEPNKVYFSITDNDHVNLLEGFLETLLRAEKVEDLFPLVRPVDDIEKKMRDYYAKHPLEPKEFKKLGDFGPLQENLDIIYCSFFDKQFEPYHAFLLFEDGRLLLDWESYAAYSEMSWEELADKKPTEPVLIRAQVNRSQFYNGQFADDAKWQVVSLKSPNSNQILYGYFEKDSPQQQALFQFGVLRNDVRATLKVRYPENAESERQLIIEEVIGTSWSDLRK